MSTWTRGRLALAALGVFSLAAAASYVAASVWRRTGPIPTQVAEADASSPYPSGRYLVVYLFLSSECGLCTEPTAKAALARLRDSLVATNGRRYAAIQVIGVSIDDSLDAGIGYLRSFKSTLDQIIVGGGWLNEAVTTLAWRDGTARTAVPQVLAFLRGIDATGYPRAILVQPDSVVLRFVGRDSLIAWVNSGAPVPWRRR